ncbi:hypothetical protein E3N88_00504 [Mikania micrantha]|uniref:Dol-P-Glc:Glc(2)Man(9)GlcNAc(2)-PP-Dol alpha-1,2-glucosyltransferase n=1 Tax=Mikania micrantha TaxID=192012 RepID=A0A5N6Q0F0_9ASTR|nr:hypothetical protein E3N88_00504 [Mikania micrantha]
MGRLIVALIVSSWVIPMSILVNLIVPEPYMDEIFHVPQAQQYCVGNFKSWDPMITTPPGLYFLSLAYVASLFPALLYIQPASYFIEACSVTVLRSTNVVLALYPLHWFFAFLYYTDVASLTVVLAMYLMCLKKKYWHSALLGAVAVLIRQTNIIWMLFVACIRVVDLVQAKQKHEDNILPEPKNDLFVSTPQSQDTYQPRTDSRAVVVLLTGDEVAMAGAATMRQFVVAPTIHLHPPGLHLLGSTPLVPLTGL